MSSILTPGRGLFPDHAAVDWRHSLRCAIRDPRELCRVLDLDPALGDAAAARQFATLVPWEYVRRIRPGDPADPLLRQVLPSAAEHQLAPGFARDPLREQPLKTPSGLLRKYPGRGLLVVHALCAVHCRYCFRRHFPYGDSGTASWQAALRELANCDDIEELILSGGDPLTLGDDRLGDLCREAAAIPQLRRLRIHTRLPVLIPSRVTESLLRLLSQLRLTPWMVVHANHPREIDASVASALVALRQAGVPVLNQSVLLRGVNDSTETLAALSRRLIDLGVLPYYLHQLDRVEGAQHFEVPESRGRELVRELQAMLPGYAVPRYVREVAGEPGKVSLEGEGWGSQPPS